MPAELERSFEAAAAEGAAGRADKGTRINEGVVDRADAVGATDLPARPIGALLSRRGALYDPFRRRPLALFRWCLVRSSRLQERKRGKYADTRKKQFSHDTPPVILIPHSHFDQSSEERQFVINIQVADRVGLRSGVPQWSHELEFRYPNLRRRPPTPAKARGSIQRAIQRASLRVGLRR